MTETVTLHIDGSAYEVPAGMNLVDAAYNYAGVEIPVFCYHPKMEPAGMCRMCLVDIGFEMRDRETGELMLDEDGSPQIRWGRKLETACTNTVRAGMHVRTTTEEVLESRKDVLEFLLSSHPLDCPICDKGGECPLQNLTMRHGPGTSRMVFEEKMQLDKHVPLGDLIYLDRERCIQCARCTRFQAEVVGDDVLAFHERGRRLQIITISDPPFDTYFSGNTTDICPVGALTTADFRFGARPWELDSVPSISPHGPVGENIIASTRLDRLAGGVKIIKRIMPRQNEAVNEIWISDKTRFGHHFTRSENRLRQPLLRQGDGLEAATWIDAVKAAAKAVKDAANKVGFIAGPMMSNEDIYAMRELAKHLGTRKLGVWPANLGDADPVAEVGIATDSHMTELGAGDAVLVIASDLEEEAPVWFLQAKQAADRGAKVFVANLRAAKLDRYAAQTIRYPLGGAVEVLNALAESALAEGWVDNDLVESRVDGFDDLNKALKGTRQQLKDAAEALATAENLVIFAGNDGLSADEHTALLQAAANFLIVTGHVGKRNNGLVPVWPGANTQGAFDLGFAAADTRAMLKNTPDVLVIAGADVAADAAYAPMLEAADFIIYLTMFEDGTSAQADVVLPIQSFAEREGTFTNAQRRVQRFYTAQGAVGESLAAWTAVARIGEAVGAGKPRRTPGLMMRAITEDIKAYKDMDYPALAVVEPQTPNIGEASEFYGGTSASSKGGTGKQWAAKAEGRGKLTVAPVEAPQAPQPGDGQVVIVPIRRLYDRAPEFAASELMHGHIPQPFVGLNPATAEALGLADGDGVIVRVGELLLNVAARVGEDVPEGIALLPLRLSAEPTPFEPVVGVLEKAPQPEPVA